MRGPFTRYTQPAGLNHHRPLSAAVVTQTQTLPPPTQSPLTLRCQCWSYSAKQTSRSGVISSKPITKTQVTNLRANSPYLNYARGGASCYFQSSSDSFVSTTSHNQIHNKYVVIFVLALLCLLVPPHFLEIYVGGSRGDGNYSDRGTEVG